MSKILVTPEELRSVAGQFQQSSSESSAMVQRLTQQISQLQQNWAGVSSQRFFQDFQQWQKSMQQFVVLLEDINKQMLVIAERFQRADEAQ